MKEQCSTKVFGERMGSHQCYNNAKVERDGKFYCGIHDPEYIKEKQRKWNEEFDKKRAKDRARSERTTAMRNACEGLTTEELRQVTPSLIRKALREVK